MSLEKEIDQKNFKNGYQKGIVNIIYTFHWIHAFSKDYFKNYDITSQQYNILRILRGARPETCTISILKSRMLDKMSDASRLVERLIKKGLVEKKRENCDRRKANIQITNKGLQLLEETDKHMDSIDNLLSNLDETEISQLNSLLDKARQKDIS